MPKIIITGRNFTEPDDGALQMLKNAGYEVIDLGKLGMAHGTPEKEVAEAVKDADAVIAGLEPYTEGVLSVCPKLKLISRRGIGYDSVDVEACHRHGVTLCRTAGMVEGSVAEQVMAYILYCPADRSSESVYAGGAVEAAHDAGGQDPDPWSGGIRRYRKRDRPQGSCL